MCFHLPPCYSVPCQKEKKEKKSKRHEKSRRRKTQSEESEQSEDDIDPPKLKKSRSGVKQNGHTREESLENAKLSSLNSKSSHKKRHSNSSETSSGDGDSEPEQVKLLIDLFFIPVCSAAFCSCLLLQLMFLKASVASMVSILFSCLAF